VSESRDTGFLTTDDTDLTDGGEFRLIRAIRGLCFLLIHGFLISGPAQVISESR